MSNVDLSGVEKGGFILDLDTQRFSTTLTDLYNANSSLLKGSLDFAIRTTSQTRQTLQTIVGRVNVAEADITALDVRVTALEQRDTGGGSGGGNFEVDLSDLYEMDSSLQVQINALDTLLISKEAALKAKDTALQEQITALETLLTTKEQALNATDTSLQNQISAVSQRTGELEQSAQHQEEEIDDVKDRVLDLERAQIVVDGIITQGTSSNSSNLTQQYSSHPLVVLASEFAYLKDVRLVNAENRISALESEAANTTNDVTSLDNAITLLQQTDTLYDQRITALESSTTVTGIDNSFLALQNKDIVHDNRLTSLEQSSSSLWSANNTVNQELTQVKNVNTTQNGRLDLIESNEQLWYRTTTANTNFQTVNTDLISHTNRLNDIDTQLTYRGNVDDFIMWRLLKISQATTRYFGTTVSSLTVTNYQWGTNFSSSTFTQIILSSGALTGLPLRNTTASHQYANMSPIDFQDQISNNLVGFPLLNTDGAQNFTVELYTFASKVYTTLFWANPYYGNGVGNSIYTLTQLQDLSGDWTNYCSYSGTGHARINIQNNSTTNTALLVLYVCGASFDRDSGSPITVTSSNYTNYILARNIAFMQIQETNEFVVPFNLPNQSINRRWNIAYFIYSVDYNGSMVIRNDSGIKIDWQLKA